MSKRPKHPGRRQVPGTFRTYERKGPDPNAEPQRIVLYLPMAALDLAEQQAYQANGETVQRYCETLLLRAITSTQEQGHETNQTNEPERPAEELRTFADDPDYLAEWTATVLEQLGTPPVLNGLGPPVPPSPLVSSPVVSEILETIVERSAVEVVLRHAGLLGDDPEALLTSLRREGTFAPGVGPALLQALAELEVEYRDASELDRLLCFALHKLAFESQILVTEGSRNIAVEESIVDLVRLIQERVDRVLSGQNIRYFSSHDRIASIEG